MSASGSRDGIRDESRDGIQDESRNGILKWFKALMVNLVIPAAIVGGTAFAVRPLFSKNKGAQPSAQNREGEVKGAGTASEAAERKLETVETIELQKQRATSQVVTTGVIEPIKRLAVIPEVPGKVAWLSPSLTVGGRFSKGQKILRLDSQDYRLALRQSENQVAQAALNLKLEKERGNVARAEWDSLEKSGAIAKGGNRDLATRKHHIEAAQVALDAARSAVEQAEVKLGRTTIRAPFDAVVVSEQVEMGQVVGTQGTLATLIGADAVWVRASIPVQRLDEIKIAGPLAGRSRAQIRLRGRSRDGDRHWEAVADRLVHELDAATRNAQVLFSVASPFETKAGELPLLPGSFVEVEAAGVAVEGILKIPRLSLSEGRYVWYIDEASVLHKVPVQVRWGDLEFVYATAQALPNKVRIAKRAPSRGLDGIKVQAVSEKERAATAVLPAKASSSTASGASAGGR